MRLKSLFASVFALSIGLAAVSGAAPQAQAETLRVGTEAQGIPFSFLNDQNELDGFMIELIKVIGQKAGFDVQLEPMEFSALISSLNSDKVDLVSAAMYITPKRAEVIDYSDPVYSYGEGMIVGKDDTKDYKSFKELEGETVGAQLGTVYIAALQEAGIFGEVKVYDTIPQIMNDVNAGRIKAGFADYPIMSYYLGQGQFPEVRLVKSYEATLPGKIGIATQKGDTEHMTKINAAIAEMKQSGELDKMIEKWGLN
jgi:polar amino acid transport system substrate-binding protein